jgi:hypothetical protein
MNSNAVPSSVKSPTRSLPQGCFTRNVPPPSHCTARFLVLLFCICCRQGFCAELHLADISMGKHIVVTTVFGLSGPLSDPMHCVQAFNSLGQSPCTVAAYMIATCNRGGEYLVCWLIQALCSHLYVDFTLSPLDPGESYFDGNTTFSSCECTTVGYSLISACGACQGETWYKCGNI